MEEKDNKNSRKLDEITGKLIVRGDSWGVSDYSEEDMRDDIASLNESERLLLLKGISSVTLSNSVKVARIQRKYADEIATLYDVLDSVMTKRVTSARTEVSFKVETTTRSYGTTSSITGDIDACYTWCMEHTEGGKPDAVGLVSSMVSCFAKPEENTPKKEVFSKSSQVQQYFPKENRVFPYIKSAMKDQPCASTEMIERRFKKFVGMDSPGRPQVIRDLVESQPAVLVNRMKKTKDANSAVRFAKRDAQTMLVKAVPTKVTSMPASHTKAVDAISIMSSALGSAKYGFGAMSRCHYDGIPDLPKAVRDKFEYLTDYVHDDARVYLLNTRDANFALAFMRVVTTLHADKKFVVVYDQTGSVNRTKIMECITFKNKVATSVRTQGIIGMPQLQWGIFKGLDTYYVSFQSYSKGRGRREELVSTSIDARMSAHDVAVSFKKYMYYGFVGAMGEQTKVYPSCRARDGTVIYTHLGRMDRREAVLQVFNCVKHAILYPWYRFCFRYKTKGKYFFDGVREYKSEYDFRTASRRDEFILDLGDEEISADIDDFYADLQLHDTQQQVESKTSGDEDQEDEDSVFFDGLDEEEGDSG